MISNQRLVCTILPSTSAPLSPAISYECTALICGPRCLIAFPSSLASCCKGMNSIVMITDPTHIPRADKAIASRRELAMSPKLMGLSRVKARLASSLEISFQTSPPASPLISHQICRQILFASSVFRVMQRRFSPGPFIAR